MITPDTDVYWKAVAIELLHRLDGSTVIYGWDGLKNEAKQKYRLHVKEHPNTLDVTVKLRRPRGRRK